MVPPKSVLKWDDRIIKLKFRFVGFAGAVTFHDRTSSLNCVFHFSFLKDSELFLCMLSFWVSMENLKEEGEGYSQAL